MKNIFRLFAIIAFVAMIGFSFIACGGDDPDPKPDPNPPPATVSVTGVSMEKTATTILVGSTETLYATVTPDNATNKSVTWSTSDANVATVANGVVTAKAAGTATITVTTADGNKTAACTVTVSATAVAVTGVTLTPNTLSLNVNGTQTLTPTITPSGATNQNVTWNSNNTAVATVNGGTVTAHAAGSATITVTTADGNKTATCAVTVTAPITTYTVQYNANGGSGNMTNSNFTVGTASQALTANGFTKTDNLFVCWSTNQDGTGTKFYNSQSVTSFTPTATTVTLYAQWAEGNMYYGVVTSAILNYLKGTNTAAVQGWNMAINPSTATANSHVHITTITNSAEIMVEFSGNNIWFVLVPQILGELTIKDIGGVPVTGSFPKNDVTYNGVKYWLHQGGSSPGNQDGLKLKLSY